MPDSLTTPPGHPLSAVVERNIDALVAIRRDRAEHWGAVERAVDAVTAFAGSLGFIVLHAAILVFW